MGKSSPRRNTFTAAGLSVAAAAALVIALLVGQSHRSSSSSFAAQVPYPTISDLLWSYPLPVVSLQHLTPIESLVQNGPGEPYAGHLRLTAAVLPTAPTKLAAYRLAPSPRFAMLARLLAISSPPKRIMKSNTRWIAAADGGSGSSRPLHSLALSLTTGELIYHDRRNALLAHAQHALDRGNAIAAARTWLARLGWPGKRMPLRSVGNVKILPHVRRVSLGWPGVGSAATPAATLWVTPNGSVIEGLVWPATARAGLIPTRPVSAAWFDLRAARLPIALEGLLARMAANGRGVLRRMTIVTVLTRDNGGTGYLVPAYRFEGTVRLQGIRGSFHWYALAPSARR